MNTKILVIEDDRIMRENTAELLEITGYTVQVAEDGKQGVKMVHEFLPDLIVCDIMMPELDGFGVLYLLSKNPKTAAIPFVFLTAKSEMEDFRKGMDMGADDYLTKPYDDLELLNAIEKRLDKVQIFKKEFTNSVSGIEEFISDAQSLAAIEKLTGDRKLYQYQARDFLFREGDYANFLFFIESGSVKTFKMNEDGKELIVDVFKAGDFLAFKPLLENRNYTKYGMALEDSGVYKIPKNEFLNLIYRNRTVATKFIQMMSKNASEKEEQLLQLAYDSVTKRLCLHLKKMFTASESQTLTLSRTDLAYLVGTSKETLVRCLTQLKEDQIVETTLKDIRLLDQQKLEQIINWS